MISNLDLTKRWYNEVWKPGGESTVLELMAEDVVGYMEGSDVRGRSQFLQERGRLLGAFPGLEIEVDDCVADGSKTVARWHVTAKHTGDDLGFPATNQDVAFRGMTWLEWKDGRIVKGWDSWNLGGLLKSLSAPL